MQLVSGKVSYISEGVCKILCYSLNSQHDLADISVFKVLALRGAQFFFNQFLETPFFLSQ